MFVILRGALDGLSAVPPYGDSDYARLRRELAIGVRRAARMARSSSTIFRPSSDLRFMHESYKARELVVFHAIASPYRERSHFDGQDVLENGLRTSACRADWLAQSRARALPADRKFARKELGVALGQNVPLVMRGPAPVASWSPSTPGGAG